MITKLKIILNSQEEYADFLKFAYSKDDSLIFNEEYKQQLGAHKEPVIVGIILALGTAGVFVVIQKIVTEYIKKSHDHELELYKEKNRSEEAKIELSLKHGADIEYKNVSIENFKNATNVSSLKFGKENSL